MYRSIHPRRFLIPKRSATDAYLLHHMGCHLPRVEMSTERTSTAGLAMCVHHTNVPTKGGLQQGLPKGRLISSRKQMSGSLPITSPQDETKERTNTHGELISKMVTKRAFRTSSLLIAAASFWILYRSNCQCDNVDVFDVFWLGPSSSAHFLQRQRC